MPTKLPLVITMGDPVGVGPEVTARAWLRRPRRSARWLWVGDPGVLAAAFVRLGLPAPLREVDSVAAALELPPSVLPLLPTLARVGACRPGHPFPAHAACTIESITTACQLALSGQVQAIVTPPINKAVLHSGGFDIPGHTEWLAHCCGVALPVMMLVGRGLRVVPVTIHRALAGVPAALTPALLEQTLRITHQALKHDFGLAAPRLAVAGLNPHAGEGGAFGDEEQRLIGPVCQALAAAWGQEALCGPLPADTLFHPAARATYDAVVGMYHDQVLIPLKMLSFGQAVNVTLGLPIVRTSVDHGTAYDIAGQNQADCGSLLAAITLAQRLASHRAANPASPNHSL